MTETAPIGIIGGGLAGLAAALTAARRGRKVTLWESSAIGRDKVCGEFLSPEVHVDMEALGCGDWLDALAPAPMRTVALLGPRGARVELQIPGAPAQSVTRAALEGYLADHARREGVTIIDRAPVRSIEPLRGGLSRVCATKHEEVVRGTVMAFGKRSTLDSAFALPRAQSKEGFVALKAYLAKPEAALDTDVELYVMRGGYVGLNRVEDGRIGVCALFEGGNEPSYPALLKRAEELPQLARRLASLGEPLGLVRGLARFGFGPQALARRDHATGAVTLFAGDAARLIPSFTGDGMAVALRSGRLAAEALATPDPVRAYTRAYTRAFDVRFALSGALHRLFFQPAAFAALAPLVGLSPRLVERLYTLTRGAPPTHRTHISSM
uniref:FAD-dependent oxidoreductase n=1 Tax=Chondromyces catenulatus TaxID=1653841 RepID=A0A3S5GY11_9BACT|nr:FAD-dependent oxidoreductase [Chondromyces catenulatus]